MMRYNAQCLDCKESHDFPTKKAAKQWGIKHRCPKLVLDVHTDERGFLVEPGIVARIERGKK